MFTTSNRTPIGILAALLVGFLVSTSGVVNGQSSEELQKFYEDGYATGYKIGKIDGYNEGFIEGHNTATCPTTTEVLATVEDVDAVGARFLELRSEC